ncbi:hypothetical protein HZC34_07805 [Candidatus Saganbacteria bacterium]|nr:hypothetical protein [Candidatus Saganbacteria bacterium]
MENILDWTELYDRRMIVRQTNKLIDSIINKIFDLQLSIHVGMCESELALLYRFPIHVATNIFIERMLRASFYIRTNRPFSLQGPMPGKEYFDDTDNAVLNCYFDHSINFGLLNGLYSLLNDGESKHINYSAKRLSPQKEIFKNEPMGIKALFRKLRKESRNRWVKMKKPEIIGELSNWALGFMSHENLLDFDYKPAKRSIDQYSREKIKIACRECFSLAVGDLYFDVPTEKRNEMADLFAGFIDRILPFSLIEELNDRYKYYELMLKNWRILEVHSCVGYYYNENFKLFAFLAKRAGAILVSHAHGSGNINPSFKHTANELPFLDYYFSWGVTNGSWLKGMSKLDNLKIIDAGSHYLYGMPAWEKKRSCKGNFTILYSSGPLRDFMADLEEITPERNMNHRMSVLILLKRILQDYPGSKIIYKPFPGTYANDPIKEVCAEELKVGRILLSSDRPVELFQKADLVLWDSISTGFGESASSGVPALVFQARYEYESASSLGKEIDKELADKGIIFYDVETGAMRCKVALDDPIVFLSSSRPAIKKYQEAAAWPVNKEAFCAKMKDALRIQG